MEKFSLVLKNDKTLQYDRMAYFIILLNFILFVYLGIFSSEKGSVKIASALGAALIAICILLNYFLRKIRHNQGSPYIHAGLIFIVMTWLQIGNYWFMTLFFILEILYTVSRRQLAVKFYTDRIVYTSFPVKNITWNQVNNVILKDGLLTLDQKNNRILQVEIRNSDPDIDEKDFNEFCSRQLKFIPGVV